MLLAVREPKTGSAPTGRAFGPDARRVRLRAGSTQKREVRCGRSLVSGECATDRPSLGAQQWSCRSCSMRVHDCFALDHVNQHVCTLGALGLGVWDSNSDQACHDMVTRASERAGVECSLTTTIETTTTATITTILTFFSTSLIASCHIYRMHQLLRILWVRPRLFFSRMS